MSDLIVEREPSKNLVEISEVPRQLAIVQKEEKGVAATPRQIEYDTDDIVQDDRPKVDIDWTKWKLVFRQTAPFAFSDDNDFSQAKRLNAHDAESNNYSILGDLEEHRNPDGYFTFMLRYPEHPHLANIWRQSSNPVTMQEEGVENFVSIESSWCEGGWGGLQRSGTTLSVFSTNML